jgi:acyl-CoA dehydrogenase
MEQVAGAGVLTPADALAALEAARETIETQAVQADKAAAFPERSVAALKEAELMSAAIPAMYGGRGFGAGQLSEIAMRLGGMCGSTAMIWAMHQIQTVCLEDSAIREPGLADYLRRAAREQHLIASVTSEEGVGGNLRTSKAAVIPVPAGVEVSKRAPTLSYADYADSFLATARRGPSAAPGDQVLVLAEAHQVTLRATGGWDALGMRGTCSGPRVITAVVPSWQVLPERFGQIASRRMVPVSHLLWSAVWLGIAEDAARRAVKCARAKLRNGVMAPNTRLGWIHARCQLIRDSIRQFAADYSANPGGTGLNVRANALKMRASVDTVRIAELALEVCGMAGYSEIGEFSVCRQLRDLYSARLMISNDRLNEINSEMLLFQDDLF